MQRQARQDTRPELALRRLLHRRGLRYRLHRKVVPGSRRSVDIVFPKAKVAVAVYGCYWHACPVHGTQPRTNSSWWQTKFVDNRRRDEAAADELAGAGWELVVVWEHEDVSSAADRVESAVRRRLLVRR
jgi:DNA mismatch endonuclease (patch repair protein)